MSQSDPPNVRGIGRDGGFRPPYDRGGFLPPGHPVAPGDVDPLKVTFLDPSTAARTSVGGDVVLLPTAYVSDRLIVEGGGPSNTAPVQELASLLEKADIGIEAVPSVPRRQDWSSFGTTDADEHWVTSASLRSTRPGVLVDAWTALDAVRSLDAGVQGSISLDHVLISAGGQYGGIGGQYGGIGGQYGGIGGQYGGIGGQYGGIGGPNEYAVPGRGGRAPVHLAALDPRTLITVPGDAPVVVLPDTGLGAHPWFLSTDPGVVRGVTYKGVELGGTNADLGNGVVEPMTGAFGPLAGHGTFVAGLIRQGCPQATIVSVPVMSILGLADEATVRQTLALLLRRHIEAAGDRSKGHIDIVSLSMGYYPEDPSGFVGGAPPPAHAALNKLFQAFADNDVIVVAGAGNDATDRPFLPAALAVFGTLSSVGAANPDLSSVALFSNDGPWVTVRREGAAVVSTMPTTFDAGAQVSTEGLGSGRSRSTIDPDGYAGGFGIWSGTSFSTPIVAAELARAIVNGGQDARSTSRIALRNSLTPDPPRPEPEKLS